ncbi:MAG TPA: carboxypeptidase regulatory-like domain-containing protein [Thermoanaerobaculia bacterium]|nr:carboxypeptidase regulatory-like domain-containing protein [Thermoanaerobaculia bacterium]
MLLHGGCTPPVQPQQCFPDAAGPESWTDPAGERTTQIRFAPQSSNSTCHGPVGIGAPPHCCTSFHPPASPGPSVKLRIVGRRVWVDYDAPNYYCQNTGDWPPLFTCVNDPLVSSDHLFLFQGGDIVREAFIYYENGSWDTGFDIPCGGTRPLTAYISYAAGSIVQLVQATDTQSLTGKCPDRRDCPAGGGGGAPASGVGMPINVGSGDVSLTTPLFTLAQSPQSLAFSLSYHSGESLYPALVSSPVGLGWTHPFAQTLRTIDTSGRFLYHLAADGAESEYTRQGDGSWVASSPGELRSRVTLSGGRYQLTDLDGNVTSFNAATGLWLETRDRWGNALRGTYDTSGHLMTVADSMGREISLGYSGDQLTEIELPGGATWRFGYQGALLTEISDPIHTGSTPWRSFDYQTDSHGVVRLLTAVRDEAGTLLEGHAYDALDRGTVSESEGGRDRVTVQYDVPGPGRSTVIHTIDGTASQTAVFSLNYSQGRFLPTQVIGNCATCSGTTSDTQSFTYSGDNHVLSRTDGKGHVTRYQYNADGNLSSMTEAAGTPQERTILYRYDYAPWPNFQTRVDEPSAAQPGARKVTTRTWDSSAGPETKLSVAESGYLSASDSTPTVYTRTETYDARHRLVATDGPRTDVADVTTIEYYDDADPDPSLRGRVRRITNPVGLATIYEDYDVYSTTRRSTDPNGVVSEQTTDAKGRTTANVSKPVPGDPNEAIAYTTTYQYDGRDRLVQTTLPRGNGMAYGHEEGTDRLVDTIRLDAAGKQNERRHLTLNIIGSKVGEEDQSCDNPASACASWTTRRSEGFTYDVHNRLATVEHPVPAGSRMRYAYDADGLLASLQDEAHTSPNTLYSYDALHRLATVRQTLAGVPGGQAVTAYTYDALDNLASVTDPNGNTTTYHYDDFRRLVRQDSPVAGATTYEYDPAGNLVRTTDARGAVTERTYDAAGRMLDSTSRLAAETETVRYEYDDPTAGRYAKGRLSRMIDPSGSTAYSYDRRGLLKTENRTILGASYATSYQYDANGNRSGITYPSGRQVTYGFDFADRPLTAAAGPVSLVTSTAYLPFGPEARTVFGNGTVRTMAFDLRYRPVENRLDGSAGPIADYLYEEDGVGNITAIRDGLDPAYNRLFTYDDLYRLTGASTGEALWGAGSYRYDPMGNMTSLTLGSARTADFTYDGTLPKLTTVRENGVSRGIAYDAAGNELGVGSGAFAYSARNLLAAGDGLSYAYDGRGVRAALTVTAAPGTITGTVVDAKDGTPIAEAAVRITGGANATSTDGAGRFSLTAPAGIYTLTVSRIGFISATSLPFSVTAGGTTAVGTIRLAQAPGRIAGVILSSLDNSPLAGVTVTVIETAAAAITDASGSFSLVEPAGIYTLKLTLPGYVDQILPAFTLEAGRTHDLGNVTLTAKPALLSGMVIDSTTGSPLAGVTVTANGNNINIFAAGPLATTTDAAGGFLLQVPAGTYTLILSKAGFGSRTTSPISLGPGVSHAFGTLPLEPLGTITGTVVRATDSAPVAGATVTVTGTLNSATTDAAGRFSLMQAAGTYTLTVEAGGLASLTTEPFTLAPGATHDTGILRLQPVALSVYVGYADNLRPSAAFPVPWEGSPNVIFLGKGPVFDAGAVRLDNATDEPIAIDRVLVDLQRPGPVFDLWGSFTVPAHGSVVLTQNAGFNFDTSDFAIVGCGGTLPPGEPRVPKVRVVVDGTATDYFDTGHILDTGGFDLACRQNESLQWRLIGTTGINSQGDFALAPVTGNATLGTPYTFTATVTDANNQPLPNVTVNFKVTAGPNSGLTRQGTTNAAGQATASYTSTFAGTDTWQATITNASGATLSSNPATVTWPSLAGIEVFVGYADDLRPSPSFPIPWQGSPNVLFIGNRGNDFDSGAVRIDNTSDSPLVVDRVVVDLQRPGPTFSLWGSFTIPPHWSAILAQTNGENFDTSEYTIVGCGGTLSPTEKRIPKITVTVGGFSTSYLDTAHILDTFGYDLACIRNESLQWRAVGTDITADTGNLALRPDTATNPVGALYTATAVATDAGGEPLPNVTVRFTVLSGPNAGKTGQTVTDASGMATFSYASTQAGLDTLRATLVNLSGGTLNSNSVTARWIPTVNLVLSPPTATNPVGNIYNATLLATDGAGQPVANLIVTFRITSGPNAGRTGQGTTGTNGQAVFPYTSTAAGTDTLEATITLQGGNTLASNPVTAIWTAPLTLTLAPPSATLPLGAPATVAATLTDGSHQPVPGSAVSFQVLTGPNAGRTGQGTTDAAGQATFTYTSTALGTDVLEASLGQGLRSNRITTTWIAVPTNLSYLGPTVGKCGEPLTLSARLTESTTGQPIAGQTLTFDLGGLTATATTGGDGVATAALTPSGPGAFPLTITFAGGGPYTGSMASLLIAVPRSATVLTYTGGFPVANGQAQTVSARLTDVASGAPLPGRTVTFAFGSLTASGITGADGIATATLTLPAAQPTGLAELRITVAGDDCHLPAETTAPVLVYQPSSFVIWGGNTPGLSLGQRLQFWGAQWDHQVTGGDYAAQADFKGYGTPVNRPIGICQANAHTTGTPRLDPSCWTSKPGNSTPPASIGDYIGVIVSSAIAQDGSTAYGNVAALVVIQVDRTVPYSSDPGHPGYGTIVAVIADGARLFSQTAPQIRANASTASTAKSISSVSTSSQSVSITASAVASGSRQHFLYTPEMHLLAESELTTAPRPAIANEYVWFNDHPLAQIDAIGIVSWTFTDHLGTPILQTSTQRGMMWRAEYEPFGTVFTLRSYDRHQPLRLAGQEAEQLGLGANGVTERSYNIHRWYRAGWGRYTQADPIRVTSDGESNQYVYALANPENRIDPTGEAVVTSGCNSKDDARIQKAAGQADAASQTCLPCRYRKPFRDTVRGKDIKFVCLGFQPFPSSPKCAYSDPASPTPETVNLAPGSFSKPKQCGCLESVVLHEVLHLIHYAGGGGDEEHEILDRSHRCFSCAQHPRDPFVPLVP